MSCQRQKVLRLSTDMIEAAPHHRNPNQDRYRNRTPLMASVINSYGHCSSCKTWFTARITQELVSRSIGRIDFKPHCEFDLDNSHDSFFPVYLL